MRRRGSPMRCINFLPEGRQSTEWHLSAKKVSICIITTSNAIKAIDNLTITHTADQSPLRQNILKVHRAANLMGRWVAWTGRKVLFHHQWNTQETATQNSLLLWRYSCSPLCSARTDPSSILTCKIVIFLLCDPLTLGTLWLLFVSVKVFPTTGVSTWFEG